MLNIGKINNTKSLFFNREISQNNNVLASEPAIKSQNLIQPDMSNLKAYHPSFTANAKKLPSPQLQLKKVNSKLDRESQAILSRLNEKGILADKSSNDGSTVLENLYKIATEPRIRGLDDSLILSEVIKALDNPYSITQKFGDIPTNVANEISQETGTEFPAAGYNVVSSSCVVASMEFNLASRNPAEFVRFAQGLSSKDYSVQKKLKLSDISDGTADALWKLREFNTSNAVSKDWNELTVDIKPDRNAIVRARVQTSYKDPGERSCVDVLIQSALLNLGSQHTYDALTDQRTGKFNPDSSGLTDFEKNFVEQIVFATPKISVVYQNLDENGYLIGYNCKPEETKQHILKSLELGQNVIIGYTHLDANNRVDGGHEITIVGYEKDANGNGQFICNDTDDNEDVAIKISEEKLLPLIHHAGISKEALSKDDVIVDGWREILSDFQNTLASEKQVS